MLKGSTGLCFRKREKRGKYREISMISIKGFSLSFHFEKILKNKKQKNTDKVLLQHLKNKE